ncbi:DUF4381 domain-containing protein [Thalassotalea litorea]|uniref:DUF4381 domain-containing protein n=1 Tax=Thalassotalea litorea TaxID=2020715 RepID=UPI001484CEA5|nr:DUF4381 domain-containing protein [Thalassotalea litorea]
MDPLEQLKDIHLPETISIWPLALGWWIIIAIFLGLIAFAGYRYRQHLSYWQVKKQGLSYLSNDEAISSEQALNTLKWICLHYFSRQQVASLHGETLLRFLLTQLPTQVQPKFKVLAQDAIVEHYRRNKHDIYAPQMRQAAILWCQSAQLPKPQDKKLTGGDS